MTLYNDVKNTYLKLKSYEKTADFLGINKYQVEKLLKGNPVVIPSGGRNKHNIDENYFSRDTPESFYWAGFIAADGCVLNDEKTLSIGIRDCGHLDKLKKSIKFSGEVKKYKYGNRNIYTLRTCSAKIAKDLKRFNVVKRKTLEYKFPSFIKNHVFVNHFMRGYADGDGCFYEWKGKNLNRTQLGFNIVGTEQFVTVYKDILSDMCNLNKNKSIVKNSNVYVVSYCGNRLVPKIRDFLYKGSSVYTRLDRKYNIAFSDKNTSVYKYSNCSPVTAKHIYNDTIIKFASLKDAQKSGFNRTCITDCCRGRQKTHKGYVWKYTQKDDDDDTV